MKNLPKPAYINQSIGELNLGTYSSLATVSIHFLSCTVSIDSLSCTVSQQL